MEDIETYAENHAIARLKSGYSIDQLISEYRALRASVLRLWAHDSKQTQATDLYDVTRFNEAIDQALGESVTVFSRALSEKESKFHNITNAMPQMVWSTRCDGVHDYFNTQWYDFTGDEEGAIDPKGWTAKLHVDDRALALAAWAHSRRTGEKYEHQYRLRHRSGQYRWTLGRALAIRAASGDILRWTGTCTDIHAQKLIEDKLKEADRRKDEFLAMLAHELRNPLAPISSGAQILQMNDVNADLMRETSAVIARQVDHMSRLVDDLLDVSRVSRGLVTLEKKHSDLKPIVQAAIEQTQPALKAKAQHLTVRMATHSAFVAADRIRLVQVIANLLDNASKFTPDAGAIVLSVDVRVRHVHVSIEDNGIGIDAQLLPRIFDLFTQADSTSDRPSGGLGLGLALVKNLMELHGGTVQASSSGQGQGSTFTLVLPLSIAVETSAAASAGARSVALPHGTSSGNGESASGLRVMIVDDNVDAARMLAVLLRVAGHHVSVRHDGRSALFDAEDEQPHVFLLDIGLPGLNGYEVARRLRDRPDMAGATLIALTGYSQDEDKSLSRAAGFAHHFVKPPGRALMDVLARLSAEAIQKH